ncbi:MAG: hypothetical protein EXQ79_08625 [Acidimicrobiia bacterium]|nr:hypothetical protein [Acidimicrobiia bacterium]
MSPDGSRLVTIRRRLISVPVLILVGLALLVLVPIWLPVVLVYDLVRAPRRLPITRLLLFGVCWAWIEIASLVRLTFAWLTGRAGSVAHMTKIQCWWATCILNALRVIAGLRVEVEGLDAYDPSPVIVLPRHASLVDSVLSVWMVIGPAGLQARTVLKRELLVDPCLDVAGNRMPNHFVDRNAEDPEAELEALQKMTTGMGPGVAGVIFAEGTRANPVKRARALAKIAERDPARAERLRALRHLMPPRPAGSAAMLAGAPDADVVVAWHIGLEGMDTFGGIVRGVPTFSGRTIRYVARRIPRAEVPTGDAFTQWLDDTWLGLDREVDAALVAAGMTDPNAAPDPPTSDPA